MFGELFTGINASGSPREAGRNSSQGLLQQSPWDVSWDVPKRVEDS